MENSEEVEDEVHIVICPGKTNNVFENYVFVPIDNLGFIAIKHILKIGDIVTKKHLKGLDFPSGISFSSGKTVGVKGILVHLLNI